MLKSPASSILSGAAGLEDLASFRSSGLGPLRPRRSSDKYARMVTRSHIMMNSSFFLTYYVAISLGLLTYIKLNLLATFIARHSQSVSFVGPSLRLRLRFRGTSPELLKILLDLVSRMLIE